VRAFFPEEKVNKREKEGRKRRQIMGDEGPKFINFGRSNPFL
jgi:hypothetical protein